MPTPKEQCNTLYCEFIKSAKKRQQECIICVLSITCYIFIPWYYTNMSIA